VNILPSKILFYTKFNQIFLLNSILSVSLSFDVKLPNGQSTRHPDANRFIDTIRERLHQAIEIYEKTPLGIRKDRIQFN
jgi:hypothetical protein